MKDFTVRMLTNAEWDRLVEITCGDDAKMHWCGHYSWCLDGGNVQYGKVRGRNSASDEKFFMNNLRSIIIGFRPVFVPKKPDNVPEGTKVPIATLFAYGRPVKTNCLDGAGHPIIVTANYPDANPGEMSLEFREPIENPECQVMAIKVGDVYVADRNVIKFISQNVLVEKGFGRPQEVSGVSMLDWKSWKMLYEQYSRKNPFALSEKDLDLHWERMYSWLRDEEGLRCGYFQQDLLRESQPDIRSDMIGFRPVFPNETKAPSGKIVFVATLYLDGKPVKAPMRPAHNGDIPEYIPGTKIEFRAPLSNPEYQIRAIALGDYLIADRCVLRNISWDDLKAQGF